MLITKMPEILKNKKYWLVVGILLVTVFLHCSKTNAIENAEEQAALEAQQATTPTHGEGEGEDSQTSSTMSPEDQAASEFFQEWTPEELELMQFFQTGDEQAVQDRQENDQQQTQAESEALSDLQQSDYEQCTAEVNGSSGGGTPTNPTNPNNPPTNGTSAGDEQAVRDKLKAKGININKGDCHGQSYQLVSGGCTDVTGLPQHSVDRLGTITSVTGPITMTGGTEKGHSTSKWGHAPGNNVVDLERNNSNLNNYINSHTVSTSQSSYGTWHELDNGDRFLDEGDHWHAQLRGTVESPTALLNNSKKLAQQAWQGIKAIILPIAEAVGLTNLNVTIAGQIVDLGSTSATQTNQLYASMSVSDINNLFSGMNSSQSQTLVGQLNFSNLNNTFSNLNSTNLNRTVNQLNSSSLNNLVNGLVPSSLDNVVLNISSGSLNSLVGNLSNQMQSELLGNLSTGAIDSIVGNLSGGVLNDVMGNLSQGSINNIFNQVSGGLVDGLVSNLGMSSLNDVFSQISGQTLNSVMGDLSTGVLNNVLPNLGSGTLTDIFTGAAPDVLAGALEGVAPEVLTDITNSLPEEVLTNFDEDLGELLGPEITNPFNEIIPGEVGGGIVGAITGAGLYVPVVEQDGQLMQLTSSMDTTEKQIKDLSVQICTHLKAIRRIQVKFETSAMEEAAVNRLSSTEIEKYRQATADFINQGYTDNQGNTNSGPMFVFNTRIFWNQNAQEGENLAIEEIKKAKNENLERVLADKNNQMNLNETITDEQKKLLKTGYQPTAVALGEGKSLASNALDNIPLISRFVIRPIKNTLAYVTGNTAWALNEPAPTQTSNRYAYLDALGQKFQPNNNPYGTYSITMDKVNYKKNEAVAISQHETLAAQDFLPVRECAEWTTSEPKACKAWITKTPGIIVKEAGAGAINSRLNQYENPKPGVVGAGNEPDTNEFNDGFKPGSSGGNGGGAPGTGNVNPSKIPSNTNERGSSPQTNNSTNNQNDNGDSGSGDGGEDGNTNGGGIDLGQFSGLIDNIYANSDKPSNADKNWLIWLINFIMGIVGDQKPIVQFSSKDRAGDDSLIYWLAPNATSCVTDNAWLSASTTIKTKGSSLGKSDSLRITYPATTSPSVSYLIKCTNTNGTTNKEVRINK